jgi:tRNA-specific 2-thiouridylase
VARERVLAAMSGGVDSSVAALLMLRQGHDVVGMTAELFGDASAAGPCCGREGSSAAAAACAHLCIPHHQVDVTARFEGQVIERFVGEYRSGRTPNPCSDCNRYIKFDAFFEFAREQGCTAVATGHYARLVDGQPPRLACAVDHSKDQSYFLACIPPERLASVRFPLGRLTKTEVRAIAEAASLPNATRADSMEVCFMDNGAGIAALLAWHIGEAPSAGQIVDEQGHLLGTHPGIEHFTVGQRKGLGLGGGSEGLVVHRLDPAARAVVVAPREAHPVAALLLTEFTDMTPCLWHYGDEVLARGRYRQPLWPARVLQESSSGGDRRVRVEPAEELFGMAPGQRCVAYKGDFVLFGGTIDAVEYRR